MKHYPSINHVDIEPMWDAEGIAFDKMDGSNIRSELSKKKGFYKFGSRNVLIDENTPVLGKAINLFKEKYEESISRILTDKYKNIESVVCFSEFLGEKSEFGQHDENDKHDIILFDISLYKRGFIPPRELIKNFGVTGLPDIIYEGKLTPQFVQNVKINSFNLSEGVVFKSALKNRKDKEYLYQCKIKTYQWLEKLRAKYGEKALIDELKNHK